MTSFFRFCQISKNKIQLTIKAQQQLLFLSFTIHTPVNRMKLIYMI